MGLVWDVWTTEWWKSSQQVLRIYWNAFKTVWKSNDYLMKLTERMRSSEPKNLKYKTYFALFTHLCLFHININVSFHLCFFRVLICSVIIINLQCTKKKKQWMRKFVQTFNRCGTVCLGTSVQLQSKEINHSFYWLFTRIVLDQRSTPPVYFNWLFTTVV